MVRIQTLVSFIAIFPALWLALFGAHVSAMREISQRAKESMSKLSATAPPNDLHMDIKNATEMVKPAYNALQDEKPANDPCKRRIDNIFVWSTYSRVQTYVNADRRALRGSSGSSRLPSNTTRTGIKDDDDDGEDDGTYVDMIKVVRTSKHDFVTNITTTSVEEEPVRMTLQNSRRLNIRRFWVLMGVDFETYGRCTNICPSNSELFNFISDRGTHRRLNTPPPDGTTGMPDVSDILKRQNNIVDNSSNPWVDEVKELYDSSRSEW